MGMIEPCVTANPGKPDDEAAVAATIKAWREASVAQRAAYDPENERQSEDLIPGYLDRLEALADLRPSTQAGLLSLTRAVLEEFENSGTLGVVFNDIEGRLLQSVVYGVVSVLGSEPR